jgi:predicted permease
MLSIALALFSPIHPLLYDEDAPLRASVVGTWQKLGDAYVASALIILGSQLAYGPGGQSETPWADRKKGLAIVVSVRLVLVPLITFLLALAVKDTTWWSEQLSFPLKLVLLIQSATPPAIANASMSKLRGCNEDATVFLLFWSYAVGTITVVLWLSAFMHIS